MQGCCGPRCKESLLGAWVTLDPATCPLQTGPSQILAFWSATWGEGPRAGELGFPICRAANLD